MVYEGIRTASAWARTHSTLALYEASTGQYPKYRNAVGLICASITRVTVEVQPMRLREHRLAMIRSAEAPSKHRPLSFSFNSNDLAWLSQVSEPVAIADGTA